MLTSAKECNVFCGDHPFDVFVFQTAVTSRRALEMSRSEAWPSDRERKERPKTQIIRRGRAGFDVFRPELASNRSQSSSILPQPRIFGHFRTLSPFVTQKWNLIRTSVGDLSPTQTPSFGKPAFNLFFLNYYFQSGSCKMAADI